MKKIKEEKVYVLTPLGVLKRHDTITFSPEEALKDLELYARRVYQKDGQHGAIIFTEEGAIFGSVYSSEKSDKIKK